MLYMWGNATDVDTIYNIQKRAICGIFNLGCRVRNKTTISGN